MITRLESGLLGSTGVPSHRCESRPYRWALLVVTLLCLTAASGGGAVLTRCDEPALREALAAGGSLTCDCDGTIALSAPLVVTVDSTLDAAGQGVTLDGGGTNRLIEVLPGVRLGLKGLTLRGGSADRGGAIASRGGHLHLEDCTFLANSASGSTTDPSVVAAGGAIYAAGGSVELSSCAFRSNRCAVGMFTRPGADAAGGAVMLNGTSGMFRDCVFADNEVSGGLTGTTFPYIKGHSQGGAVAITNGVAAFDGCAFTGNRATIILEHSAAFAESAADARGGAVAHRGPGSLEIRNASFNGNAVRGSDGGRNGTHGSGLGGAVFADVPARFELVRFVTNRAAGGGGGLSRAGDGRGGALHVGADSRLSSASFVGNEALAGTGCICGLQGIPRNGDELGGAIFSAAALTIDTASFVSNQVGAPGYSALGIVPLAGASEGGALYSAGGASITNASFFHNRSIAQRNSGAIVIEGVARGGAILSASGPLTLVASTLATNLAVGTAGHASAVLDLHTNEPAILLGVIVSGSLVTNVVGPVNDVGANLSSDATPGFTRNSSRNRIDPGLDSPLAVDGLRLILPLRADSPAIDLATPDPGMPPVDQLGFPRPVGAAADSGAAERVPASRIAISGSGEVTGSFVRAPAARYSIRSSADLVVWTPIASATSDDAGVIVFSDRPAPLPSQRFFRADRLPAPGN